jgi:hypothetical protein
MEKNIIDSATFAQRRRPKLLPLQQLFVLLKRTEAHTSTDPFEPRVPKKTLSQVWSFRQRNHGF